MAQPFPLLVGMCREHCILPQTGGLGSSSLLPQTGSAFSVSGDGLAGLGTGLWLFPHFLVYELLVRFEGGELKGVYYHYCEVTVF